MFCYLIVPRESFRFFERAFLNLKGKKVNLQLLSDCVVCHKLCTVLQSKVILFFSTDYRTVSKSKIMSINKRKAMELFEKLYSSLLKVEIFKDDNDKRWNKNDWTEIRTKRNKWLLCSCPYLSTHSYLHTDLQDRSLSSIVLQKTFDDSH